MRHIAVVVVFFALAMLGAGCSDSNMAAMNAASRGGEAQPSNYQVGYGLSSEGPTTDLYTELKGSLKRPERLQAAAPVQQATSANTTSQQVAASTPSTPSIAPSADPAGAEPTASVYGMSSDGPTTDLYTALFGRRDH